MTFEKRVVVQLNSQTFMNLEFNCTNNLGWIRMFSGESNIATAPLRQIEIYYDTQDSTKTKLELYMVYEPGVATGNEYMVAKFETLSNSTYKFWITFAKNKTGNVQAFREAAYGDTGTDNVNAYLFYATVLTDTAIAHTDNNDVAAGGDVQCLNFGTPATATLGTGCGSFTLDTGTSKPISDTSGDLSVNWTYTSLKTMMTPLSNPTNP